MKPNIIRKKLIYSIGKIWINSNKSNSITNLFKLIFNQDFQFVTESQFNNNKALEICFIISSIIDKALSEITLL